MGEYATRVSDGQYVKIGTCEDMYYLRANQIREVCAKDRGETNIQECKNDVRFRFPWPDEDDVKPGDFDDPMRSLGLYGLKPTANMDHGTVQFKSNYPHEGYLVSLPCPEVNETDAYHVHRNGFGGSVRLVQQRYWEDRLVIVCECGGCGNKYRLETLDNALPVIDAIRQEAEKLRDEQLSNWYTQVADRCTLGYAPNLAEVNS